MGNGKFKYLMGFSFCFQYKYVDTEFSISIKWKREHLQTNIKLTFGEMILSTLLSKLHSNTWALVSFLSQWAASQILARGPLLLRTKCA